MSDERTQSGSDPRVSDIYRELATEQAPRQLDDKVLRMASGALPTRYSRARAWLRPMAWAATIGLSLAIVMEVTRLPDAAIDSADVPATVADAVPAAADSGEQAEARTVRPRTFEDGGGRQSPAARAAPATAQKTAPVEDPEPPAPGAEEWVPQDMTAIRQAAELARVQDAQDRIVATPQPEPEPLDDMLTDVPDEPPEKQARESAIPAAAVATAELRFAAASDDLCSGDIRKEADSWFECIESLQDRGLHDLAESELSAFRERFPDYEADRPDR